MTTVAALSENAVQLIEGKNFAHLATVMKDGSPQVSPVWIAVRGNRLLINTAEGRVKTRNMRRDPRVAISIHDQDNPYLRVIIRGRVTEMTHEGADDDIDMLAKKYMGADSYPGRRADEQRVTVLIEPLQVH
jgi:PPOX class probable F420-dependent enzyme